jgi:hypothetical protein
MFDLSKEQWVKLHEWRKASNAEIAAEQWKNPEMRMLMQDEHTPYRGAIGGALTYMFCPTSLGMVVKVRDDLAGKEIDLTDYEDW